MRPRSLFLLLTLAALTSGCTDERAAAPTAPRTASMAASSCELEHSETLTLAEIDALIQAVTELETSGALNSGQANALRGHLETVKRHIEAGRTCAAVAQIQAYENQVAGWVADGVLTPEESENLEWDPTPPSFDPANIVTIDGPSSASGTYPATDATFGPVLDELGVSGSIVLAYDGVGTTDDACEPLLAFPAGAIALVARGTCDFTVKVANAQAAGAIAVIVYNNVAGNPVRMGSPDPSILIPAVMVSSAHGATIAAGLPATGTVSRKPTT